MRPAHEFFCRSRAGQPKRKFPNSRSGSANPQTKQRVVWLLPRRKHRCPAFSTAGEPVKRKREKKNMNGNLEVNPNGYICYFRVSTNKQGARRKKWWDTQQHICYDFLLSHGAKIIASYRDVASGFNAKRPGFVQAVKLAQQTGATLFASRVDRLARNSKVLQGLILSGIQLNAVDACNATYEDLKYYAKMCEAIYEKYKDEDEHTVFDMVYPSKEKCNKEIERVLGLKLETKEISEEEAEDIRDRKAYFNLLTGRPLMENIE